MRVAVAQFAFSKNAQENHTACIRVISEAAICKPSIIVLPQYSHSPNEYEDHNQVWDDAQSLDGLFLKDIATQAKRFETYIVINVALRKDAERDHQNAAVKSNISLTSLVYSPSGKLLHQEDKSTLSLLEQKFFTASNNSAELATLPFGKLGFLMADDDLTFNLSRELSLKSAQLLCHSLNSSIKDHSQLHVPTRAFENQVFLISANNALGAGHSQIISPSGKILAEISDNNEGFAFADINLEESLSANKCRPDNTKLCEQRRVDLYKELKLSTDLIRQKNIENRFGINQVNEAKANNGSVINDHGVSVTVNAAIFATYKSDEEAIEDVCFYIENNLSDIIQLPELFFVSDKSITKSAEQRTKIEGLSKLFVEKVSRQLRPLQYVCTSLLIDDTHQAVIISEHGLFAAQQQLHNCNRYAWSDLADELNIVDLAFEQGKVSVAMLTADDAHVPEIVELAAQHNIQLLLVPFDIQEHCEVEYSLLSRAAEHRICVVAASREKTFKEDLSKTINIQNGNNKLDNKSKTNTYKSTGFIANLVTDPALHSISFPQWQSEGMKGCINSPIVKRQHGKITKAVIHPIAACNKLLVK